MKRILNYGDFSLDLLLEANMKYAEDFERVISAMAGEDAVAAEILSLKGKDSDVNTNYIETSREKPDMVKFRPDDKVATAAKVIHPGSQLDAMSQRMLGDQYREPEDGQLGTIEREIKSNTGQQFVVFKWRDWKGEGRCVFDRRSLETGPGVVKQFEIGVGKFARALLKGAGVKFTDEAIEKFVLRYRHELSAQKEASIGRLRMVSGEEIRDEYYEGKYEELRGTLGNSCMRYEKCRDYLDIYAKNPSVCSLLVLDSEAGDGKISARALIWTDSEGRRLMDRIYSIRTQDELVFQEYAAKNGIWRKERQDSSSETKFVSPDGDAKLLRTKIILDCRGIDQYPYLDTFKYYTEKGSNSILTNDYSAAYEYCLEQTDGTNGESCEMCGGEGRVSCYECDGNGHLDCENCDGSGEGECGSCGNLGEMDCTECDGSGKVEGEDGEDQDCPDCGGTGRHTCEECDGQVPECPECDGRGVEQCTVCRGRGDVVCPEC